MSHSKYNTEGFASKNVFENPLIHILISIQYVSNLKFSTSVETSLAETV